MASPVSPNRGDSAPIPYRAGRRPRSTQARASRAAGRAAAQPIAPAGVPRLEARAVKLPDVKFYHQGDSGLRYIETLKPPVIGWLNKEMQSFTQDLNRGLGTEFKYLTLDFGNQIATLSGDDYDPKNPTTYRKINICAEEGSFLEGCQLTPEQKEACKGRLKTFIKQINERVFEGKYPLHQISFHKSSLCLWGGKTLVRGCQIETLPIGKDLKEVAKNDAFYTSMQTRFPVGVVDDAQKAVLRKRLVALEAWYLHLEEGLTHQLDLVNQAIRDKQAQLHPPVVGPQIDPEIQKRLGLEIEGLETQIESLEAKQKELQNLDLFALGLAVTHFPINAPHPKEEISHSWQDLQTKAQGALEEQAPKKWNLFKAKVNPEYGKAVAGLLNSGLHETGDLLLAREDRTFAKRGWQLEDGLIAQVIRSEGDHGESEALKNWCQDFTPARAQGQAQAWEYAHPLRDLFQAAAGADIAALKRAAGVVLPGVALRPAPQPPGQPPRAGRVLNPMPIDDDDL